jgi:hypothetical protein
MSVPVALDEELERLRQETVSLCDELEEQLAASATSQRLRDDLDRLDAGEAFPSTASSLHVPLHYCAASCGAYGTISLGLFRRCWLDLHLRPVHMPGLVVSDTLLHAGGDVPAEIEAAEEAGQTAKAEQLRKAKRAEIVRKLRSLQRRSPAPLPAKKGRSKAAGAGPTGSSSAGGDGDGDKPAGRGEVGEADVARIISSWTGEA